MTDLMEQFVFTADISVEKTPRLYEIIAEADLSPETITIKMVDGQLKVFATADAQSVVEQALGSAELEAEVQAILADTKDLAKRRVVVEADRLADLITGHVPRSERDAWSSKAQAARDHLDGVAKDWQTAMLQTEADMRGETVDVLAGKIVAAASNYETISAQIAAQRAITFTAIDAAATSVEIEAALKVAQATALEILATVQAG